MYQPTLQFGSRGNAVKTLQQALQDRGFGVGAIDGSFGDRTLTAVINFQRSRGLVPDGIVGARTWAVLLPPTPSPTPAPKQFTEYIVQRGDTLNSIAKRFLGATGDWRTIAQLNNIANPNSLQIGQRLRIPVQGGGVTPSPTPSPQPAPSPTPSLGSNTIVAVLNTWQGRQPPALETVAFTQVGRDVIANLLNTRQQFQLGQQVQLGLSRIGVFKPRDLVERSPDLLKNLRLSDSEIRAIAAVADNEGNFDAINTWDSQFLSFGMFQWTSGSINSAGELGALLNLCKRNHPPEFQYYFSQFGLDIQEANSVTGWLTLNGKKLVTAAEKEILRQPIWGCRFVLAGSDLRIQAVQVLHAISRLDRFYPSPQREIEGLSLSQLITSELGVTLLLDHHVNRPAFVVPCIAEAIKQAGISPQQLARGGEEIERAVIQNYLRLRETFAFGSASPMTDAKKRGDRILQQVSMGKLADRRNSFISNRQGRG